MLAFRLVLSKGQQQELIQALARARTQGHLTTVHRLLALLAIAEGSHDLATIAHLLRVSRKFLGLRRGNLLFRLLLRLGAGARFVAT